jgi:hypothetical protein
MSKVKFDPSVTVTNSQGLKMAEPLHRIPPGGVTSSQSLRNVPKSCVQQVKEICLYYVQKCSGKYLDNKAAARYVHQMADEIILQLAGVAHEIKRNRGEPEVFQSLIEEWNEHFPPSLGNLGSPKAIAALVSNQAREIQKLKDQLELEKMKREQDVSSILRSMDAQLHSYRSSVMNDRRQQKVLFDQELEIYERKTEDLVREFEEEKKKMNSNYNKEYGKLENHYEQLLREAKQALDDNIKKSEKEMNKMKEKRDLKYASFREKIMLLKNKISVLKEKYNTLALVLNEDVEETTTTDGEEEADRESIPSESESDSEDSAPLVEVDWETKKAEKAERRRLKAKEKADRFMATINVPQPSENATSTEEFKKLKECNLAAIANMRRLESVSLFLFSHPKTYLRYHYFDA